MNNIYLGVYWIFVRENQILLIKKARWPYKGMYDLPWGGIEFGEHILDGLRREIMEETSGVLLSSIFIGNNEYICEYLSNSTQQMKKFHHIGIYYAVDISCDYIKTTPDGQDSLGAEFIDINILESVPLSPIAAPMIKKALSL